MALEGDRCGAVAVERVVGPTPELRVLIEELDRTLASEYLPEQQHGLSFEALFDPHVRFFIARQDGVALGCGGVAFFDGFAEVKRMFVREHGRGRGIARALLRRIEDETKRAGLALLYLETGNRQLAAMRLYEGAGFRRCGAFGAYAAMPPEATATSVYFEKRLAR